MRERESFPTQLRRSECVCVCEVRVGYLPLILLINFWLLITYSQRDRNSSACRCLFSLHWFSVKIIFFPLQIFRQQRIESHTIN